MTQEGRMERLRADLLRRARPERPQNEPREQVQHASAGLTVRVPGTRNNTREESTRRPRLPRLPFGRRNGPSLRDEEAALESPKTPGNDSRRPSSASFYLTPIVPSQHTNSSPTSSEATPARPTTAVIADGSGVGDSARPAMHSLEARLSAVGIHPRGNSRQQTSRQQTSRNTSKRFLFCLPYVKSALIRSQILQCLVSGLFLALLLSVFLGLTLTKNVAIGEMNILLIAIILMSTVFFCYSVIRLCVLAKRGDREELVGRSKMDPRGYAIPHSPIRVVMPQDEETAGVETEVAQVKPPAYGLWRESVRVDPNRFFWKRNEGAEPMPPLPHTGPRPPSYASDDGVSYVVDAAPRSVAPSSVYSESEPPHPSELGRAGQPAAH